MKTESKKSEVKKQESEQEFKGLKRVRDYTKYLFEGGIYGKGPLVHAVIKKYVEEHPTVTSKELQVLFPKEAVDSAFEIVVPIKQATKGRFFLNNEDIMKVSDTKIVVTSQWSKDNIGSFITFVKKNLKVKIQEKVSK